MYLLSVVDKLMISCFLVLQNTTLPFRRTVYPDKAYQSLAMLPFALLYTQSLGFIILCLQMSYKFFVSLRQQNILSTAYQCSSPGLCMKYNTVWTVQKISEHVPIIIQISPPTHLQYSILYIFAVLAVVLGHWAEDSFRDVSIGIDIGLRRSKLW